MTNLKPSDTPTLWKGSARLSFSKNSICLPLYYCVFFSTPILVRSQHRCVRLVSLEERCRGASSFAPGTNHDPSQHEKYLTGGCVNDTSQETRHTRLPESYPEPNRVQSAAKSPLESGSSGEEPGRRTSKQTTASKHQHRREQSQARLVSRSQRPIRG